ncbi:hypothetical protein CI109_100235 [Kwoniella shandongensis]|uniref:Uncharacterized protein n=1 Tax=Kwoniella shandongensis TaxID=1734106 RepID=A0A5M6BV48_9TREE|nr:uncharacterized protein CI109_006229 [Kwoniella shandongensis]KAA5525425.1 hypothetical protein CI109_006229 [Kwoniella shandongensis]
MAFTDYFSPVAFFILLREALEAGIIIAVLLGFVTQIIPSPERRKSRSLSHTLSRPRRSGDSTRSSTELLSSPNGGESYGTSPRAAGRATIQDDERDREDGGLLSPSAAGVALNDGGVRLGAEEREKVIRKMKFQIWTGAVLGGTVAMAIGAIFLYVFYTYTHDLWQDAENLWEGGFCLLASILILVMALAFLRLPHAQTKWRLKLLSAYEDHPDHLPQSKSKRSNGENHHPRANKASAILFGLPFITVLREGLEGVVFLGGIGLSEKGTAVGLGGLAGLVGGGLCAYLLFSSTSPLSLRKFTVLSSLLLFFIGAGLASRAAYSLERQYFISHVGTAAAESGNGPGSYRVKGNIWHLTWWDPEPGSGDNFAQLAQAIVGWNNTGTVWTVTTYIAYWAIITTTLIYMKWKEGRTDILGYKSRNGRDRDISRRGRGAADDEEVLLDDRSDAGE